MRRSLTLLALLAVALGAGACRGPGEAAPNVPTVAVDSDTALSLRQRTDGFYLRLAHRRFNTLETYNDRIMREHFRSPALFLDYYADLAQSLSDANFEKSRPLRVEIQEMRFEDPASARVWIRFVGYDDRPLRPGRVRMVRVDRWERSDGTWWVQPGKL
ncbi:MAG: hypothetical protein ACQGVC_17880 [Myxococcota bacterium]